ncbi:MAG: hydrogenase formation protein HypD [Alphaproteobacteria bacterium]|nr:hydrogenase formation protein HypD [Alphaproteobacteria bacterium]
MKYIEEFRNRSLAQSLSCSIKAEADKNRVYRFMEFCGGHTHAIFRFGIPDLLPENVRMIHGPGCPVCVLPIARIDAAIQLAKIPGVVLCSYGDMLRVPGSNRMSLLKARAAGADVRMITAPFDAIQMAVENPDKQVIFFAIGFETTTPPTAVVIKQAQKMGLSNFSVFCNHVLTPSAFGWLLESGKNDSDVPPIDGFVGPAHVSAVIGTAPYEIAASKYGKPVVIAGFEPLDVMQSILMLIRQVNSGRAEVENEYTRAVTREGNVKAQKITNEVFDLRDTFEWRGLGFIPNSALRLREEYAQYDAERRFKIDPVKSRENPACQCPAILRGAKTPAQCPLFGKACTPENPIGSCMVSSEGGCAAWYSYGRKSDDG